MSAFGRSGDRLEINQGRRYARKFHKLYRLFRHREHFVSWLIRIAKKQRFKVWVKNKTVLCSRDEVREKMHSRYLSNPDYSFEKVNRASMACGPMVKWAVAQVGVIT